MLTFCRSRGSVLRALSLVLSSSTVANKCKPAHPNSDFFHSFHSSTIAAPKLKRLDGKVAVVTGAASGIGAMAARLFVAHGARVVMADIQDELGLPLSEEIGDGAEYIHCDVSREEDIAAAVEKAHSLEGHLDIYYNSAGILGALGPIDQLNVNEYAKTLNVNLTGTVLGVKHATSFMKPARKGSIICTGSISAVIGGCSPHAYCISKTALIGLIRTAAVELRDFGVRINMISPDAVATSFVKYALESTTNLPVSNEETQQFVSDFSVFENRPLTELDVAQAAVFLASDESGFISGHNLMLDGSSTVTRPGKHNWFDAYSPMVREGGKRGLD